jgi:hypothetical protein
MVEVDRQQLAPGVGEVREEMGGAEEGEEEEGGREVVGFLQHDISALPVRKGENLIGRDCETNDISIDDQSIVPHHCVIDIAENPYSKGNTFFAIFKALGSGDVVVKGEKLQKRQAKVLDLARYSDIPIIFGQSCWNLCCTGEIAEECETMAESDETAFTPVTQPQQTALSQRKMPHDKDEIGLLAVVVGNGDAMEEDSVVAKTRTAPVAQPQKDLLAHPEKSEGGDADSSDEMGGVGVGVGDGEGVKIQNANGGDEGGDEGEEYESDAVGDILVELSNPCDEGEEKEDYLPQQDQFEHTLIDAPEPGQNESGVETETETVIEEDDVDELNGEKGRKGNTTCKDTSSTSDAPLNAKSAPLMPEDVIERSAGNTASPVKPAKRLERTSRTPQRTRNSRSIKVCFTNVQYRRDYDKALKAIHAEVEENVLEASHLIAAGKEVSLKRTPKLCTAMCIPRVHIVSLSWLLESHMAGHALPPDDYCVCDPAALKRRDEGPGILDGVHVYASPACVGQKERHCPPKADLRMMVKAAGGIWKEKLDGADGGMLVVSDTDVVTEEELLAGGGKVYSPDVLLTACLQQFSFCSWGEHLDFHALMERGESAAEQGTSAHKKRGRRSGVGSAPPPPGSPPAKKRRTRLSRGK